MISVEEKIRDFQERHRDFCCLRVFRVDYARPALSSPEHSVTIELQSEDGARSVTTRFTGVQQLRLGAFNAGVGCYLKVHSVANDQLESLRYKVFNSEQDLTLSFYCWDFEIAYRS